MIISSTASISDALWETCNPFRNSSVAAEDVLSIKEKTFFNEELHTHLNTDPSTGELFSDQALSSLNADEMNFFSSELRNANIYSRRGGLMFQKPVTSSLSMLV